MSEEKIKILMDLFEAKNMEMLEARCPINLENGLYNFMDNNEFIEMVKLIDEYDDYCIYEDIEERENDLQEIIIHEEFLKYIEKCELVQPTEEEKELMDEFDNDLEEQERINDIINKRRGGNIK